MCAEMATVVHTTQLRTQCKKFKKNSIGEQWKMALNDHNHIVYGAIRIGGTKLHGYSYIDE